MLTYNANLYRYLGKLTAKALITIFSLTYLVYFLYFRNFCSITLNLIEFYRVHILV